MAKEIKLGKGLEALLKEDKINFTGYKEVHVDSIVANPYQPRVNVDGEIESLVNSIKEVGVLSPLIVSEIPGGKYQLVAGERRLHASKLAGIEKVPVIVREVSDKDLLFFAIIENLQRKDLNPIEEATAMFNLQQKFGLNSDQVGERLGISGRSVRDHVSLLKFPTEIQIAISDGEITKEHADFIGRLPNDKLKIEVLHTVIQKKLSSIATDLLVRRILLKFPNKPSRRMKTPQRVLEIEHDLQKVFKSNNIRVVRRHETGSGWIQIRFKSDKELERLFTKIVKKT
jgi:ParB family chromosome partitioning protein